ncbi:MAG: tRNA (adenosine(37)-N6)-threonylcarbamoyltransferase complex ATPase subunit type 1 TsaE [Erysipelotrichaceae bacterium]|nr:tRNA (adenosine(37)-N6)-threonylcarbamoyltransferase complex ATPase subunit type 1 TsaE [Erysipelotrichaceae bacterium]
MKKITTSSSEETKKIGYTLGTLVEPSMVITLSGDLGAGKTTFTQGIAKGMNIKKTVSSPTFTILKIYQGNMPLYHIDAYRLEGLHQDLGFDELMDDDGLTVVEWPQFAEDIIPEEYLEVLINLEGEDRIMTFIPHGLRYERLLEALG